MNENEKKMVIMNFSGIYETEDFYKNFSHKWIDFRELTGCNCYCDEEAKKIISEKIAIYEEEKIHFIDSGNYHYISKLWIEKIKKPFKLMVFDNHTDMQLPAFGGILSCGGWLAEAAAEFSFLEEIILVGPDEESYGQVDQELQKKVKFLSREALNKYIGYEIKTFFQGSSNDLPLYISIDKDILCKEDAETTWSQGNMKLSEMLAYLKIVFSAEREKNCPILGIDICGECDLDKMDGNEKNNTANKNLAELFQQWI